MASASPLENTIRTWDVETGTLIHAIYVEGVVTLASSPKHPFVVATRDPDPAIVFDAERGGRLSLPVRAKAAAFASDGRSFVTGCWGDNEEGLWTWDLAPLLEARALELNDFEALKLVGTRLDGPQVLSVFFSSGCR